ncbi:NUDIX domain-containing protein [Actinocorallia sp. API 0066]|uniref:NUDIX hydrolase n=1 Tax=Actinocorallia sp. API 0066 TaxID=2896846 RepID=UPI001E40636F|nr:NUDIX domain-containing protein [Actinocorallia sp. API 0066]MCD0451477.1 NUDIX domain-containing protein [Actinocorallia sp. API 0066]
MITPPTREAARAILLDPDNRVLLLRYEENGGFWATPGGSLEPGETHKAALLRELREELGITTLEPGPELATRTTTHPVGGHLTRQVERYFVARTTPADLHPEHATHPDNIQTHHWWTIPELVTSTETIYPGELADLIHTYLHTGPPSQPAPLT